MGVHQSQEMTRHHCSTHIERNGAHGKGESKCKHDNYIEIYWKNISKRMAKNSAESRMLLILLNLSTPYDKI